MDIANKVTDLKEAATSNEKVAADLEGTVAHFKL